MTNDARNGGSFGLLKLGILCGVLAPLLWASAIVFCGRNRDPDSLAVYSGVSGVLGLAFLLLMVWSGEHGTARGLFERVSSGVLSLWILVFALRLARR